MSSNIEEFVGQEWTVIIANITVTIFLIIILLFIIIKVSFFINLRLKVLKLKRMAKKKNYSNYSLRLNHKGMPIMLVNVSNPTDVILL